MNKTIYKIFSASVLLFLLSVAIIPGCSKQADNLVVVPTSNAESCAMCHGTAEHPYPPKSLAGNTLPTQQGVGTHEVHMDNALSHSAPVACSECHTPVSSYYDPGHIGNGDGIAEVIFGALSKTKTTGFTPNPVWNNSNQTCSSVYCHGYFKGGNSTATATFTNPSSVVCGSCHGNPTTGNPKPVTTHQYYPDECWYCHGKVIDSNNVIINKTRHVNGVIDFNVEM
ncbi:MAG: hypothetical protein HY959_11070 [Ignavibacteriae bacterium]|nr:hypothetical protein [Ignavibacteriota bacterium]